MNPEAKVIITIQRPGSEESVRRLAEIVGAAVEGVVVPLFKHSKDISYSIKAEVPTLDIDPIETPEATYPPHHEGRNS